jgi:hypothetical protein
LKLTETGARHECGFAPSGANLLLRVVSYAPTLTRDKRPCTKPLVTLDTSIPPGHRRLMSFQRGVIAFARFCSALTPLRARLYEHARPRVLRPGVLAAVTLLGCGDDDPKFLSFEQLCPELASDVCAARNGGCCATGVDPVQCGKDEEAICRSAVSLFAAESSLHYDAPRAATQHEQTRNTLSACGALPVLASYFQGGLVLGAPCERSSQCGSGRCTSDAHVCVEPVSTPLCTAPASP